MALLFGCFASAQYQVEALTRGVFAINKGDGVYVSWRFFADDPDELAFNLYRSTGGGAPERLNAEPLTGSTSFLDASANTAQSLAYHVRPVLNGTELAASAAFTLPANSPATPYLRIALQRPANGTTPTNEEFFYTPNDMSVGDLDGDGEYEYVVKWEPSNAKDSSQDGYTGNTYLDAYELDGTRLWRIDMGVNIRAGAHDTPFIVYDFDGDGRAEVVFRSAAGTKDGTGTYVADPAKFSGPFPTEAFSHTTDYRNSAGRALVGPEFLTVFDGRTGAELVSTKFLPARHPTTDFPTGAQLREIWGDESGNRQGRFYFPGVAYLDGGRPSIVTGRGYAGGQNGHPGRQAVSAWNWRDGQLTHLWEWDQRNHPGVSSLVGQGSHTAGVADLDNDGKQDIVYGQIWVKSDGTLMRAGGWGHGDALHISQMDPDKPGQMVFMPHESPNAYGPNALSVDDGPSNTLVMGVSATGDIGRGVAADIDPRFRGFEFWGSGSTGGLYNVQRATADATNGPRATAVATTKPSQINFAVWWDGDLLREVLDANTISKWNWTSESVDHVLTATGALGNNGSKNTPNLQADLFGDWREEVIWRESSNDAIRIYSTTAATTERIYTLMHDVQYRTAVARQNVGYNQPPHPSFYLGHGMERAPTPLIRPVGPLAGASAQSSLVNLSVRADAGAGSETLVVGFSLVGAGERSLLVRGVGPTLSLFQVPGYLADSQLELYAGNTLLATNDDWSANAVEADAIAAAVEQVYAFPLPRGSKDAALLRSLSSGTYTSHVIGANGTRGVALVEVYAGSGSEQAKLVNLSVRAATGSGSGPLIVGFVIEGTEARPVLIRAVGPQLAAFGVDGAMPDPQLKLYRGNDVITENNDWGSHVAANTFAQIGTFGFPAGSKDSAILLNLPPGLYTVHVAPASGAAGVVLVEAYTTQ